MHLFGHMVTAINYLEENMLEDLDMKEAARIACSSNFHFQKMFHMLTGVTVLEYIRHRRLTLAAQELATSNIKVLDVALKYGYETPESFCKAFRKFHNISPSMAREPGVDLRSYARLSFHLSLQGGTDMNYKLVEETTFRVVGKEVRLSTKDGENFKLIPQFWSQVSQDGTCEQLMNLSTTNELLGVCMDFDPKEEKITYMVAVKSHETQLPAGFVEKIIPNSTWAIFESKGPIPEAIQAICKRIYSEWFPATGYEHAGLAEFEVYPLGNITAEDYQSQVWIPIIKK